MITIRKSDERGHFDFGWLDTRHTFSFGHYVDRNWMGYSVLRVINDDLIAPGQGFGQHPHDNMEIISYIAIGTLAHRDTLGNVRTIGPGEVQVMSAGSGLEHSEFNPSKTERTRLIQIWIKPAARNVKPAYDQKLFPIHDQPGKLHLVASPDGKDGSLPIGQSASIYASVLKPKDAVSLPLGEGRSAWVQIISGTLEVNGTKLAEGDAVALVDEPALSIKAGTWGAHLLAFELPAPPKR